jgi:uncharacterized protein (TIGR00369 family)
LGHDQVVETALSAVDQGSLTQPEWGADIPFVQHLGFELLVFDGGLSELRYRPADGHLNSFGVTHGGACMTFLDVALATAARSVDKSMGVVTIELKTTFMRAAAQPAEGEFLTGRGKLLHRTATMAFCEGGLYDAHGHLCTHATATFKYVKRLPISGKSVNSLRAASTN